jgi:hypothetical protein
MPEIITIDGAVLDLSHLQDIRCKIPATLRGGLKKDIPVEVTFSCHCYSRRLKAGEVMPAGKLVAKEGPRDAPRDRIFDPRRYDFSKRLREAIVQLIAADERIFQTQHHNFVRIEVVEEQQDGTAQQLDYYVFLSMRKHDQPNEPKVIRLFVESAYPEDLLHYDRPKLGKPMPLTRALAECWENRPGAETGRRR